MKKLFKESTYKVTVINNVLRTDDTSLLEEVEFCKSDIASVNAALKLLEDHDFDFDLDINDVLSNKVNNVVHTLGNKFFWMRRVKRSNFSKTSKWTIESTGQVITPSQESPWASVNASLALAESKLTSLRNRDMRNIAPQIMIGL